MKGGVSGALSEGASSSADGRLAWVQAARVMHDPELASVLPWQRSRWMKDIFSQPSDSVLPTFNRILLTGPFQREDEVVAPAPKLRKTSILPKARARVRGDQTEGASLRIKVVKEWLGWLLKHLSIENELRQNLECDSDDRAVKITEDVFRGKATGTLLLRLSSAKLFAKWHMQRFGESMVFPPAEKIVYEYANDMRLLKVPTSRTSRLLQTLSFVAG
eukprot:43718-Amphidinium_carterae.1